MKRKEVYEQIMNDILDILDGKTIDQAAEWIKSLKNGNDEYHQLYLHVFYHPESIELALYGTRYENDEEYKKRMKKETRNKENARKSKESQEKKEYGTYLKLKEKYEGK